MATNRLEVLRALLAQNPGDRFTRYGLAMEFVRQGDMEQGITEFRNLLAVDPTYSYAYFHCGQTLEKIGNFEEARQMYETGIEAARKSGDQKAVAELTGALEILPM
jgi:Tfp pilus assembly protein PilF